VIPALVGGRMMHDAIGGAGGWTIVVEQFARAVASEG